MNIHGIGTDIVNIKRIKRLLKIKNSTFKKKIFTNIEIVSIREINIRSIDTGHFREKCFIFSRF